jgi:hypothetical protein
MSSNEVGCPVCGISQKDQHSNRESGQCDGIRKGYLKKENGKMVQVKQVEAEEEA